MMTREDFTLIQYFNRTTVPKVELWCNKISILGVCNSSLLDSYLLR